MEFDKPIALVIGINHYLALRSLKGAIGDACDMERWLVEQQGLPKNNIRCLFSPDLRPKDDQLQEFVPIAQQVHDWLNILDVEAKRNGQDFPLGPRVYVMFAGHGYNAASAQQIAIFANTTVNYWDVIPIVPLKTYLENSAYFKEVVIISDACRDVFDYGPDPVWMRRMKTGKNSAKVKVFQAYGSKAGQKSKEQDFGGGVFRGVMSQAFLRGVKGAARDESGWVTGVKLKNFIKNAVISELGESFKPEINEGDDFIMCKADEEVTTRLHIVPKNNTTGTVQLVLHDGNRSVAIDLSAGIQEFDIPIGQYTLTTPDGTSQSFAAIWEKKDVIV